MTHEEHFDLVILGSGSTAFAAALRAQELGKTVAMTEERTLGGTCVNRGCLPSKNLIEAAQRVHDAAHPGYAGLRPAKLEVDFPALIRQKGEIVSGYRQKKYESLSGPFRVETGHSELLDPHTVEVGAKRLVGEKILIASGSRPVLPDIRGLADVPYLTSDLLAIAEDGGLRMLPKSLLVVGGGYIALELGQMFRRLGVEVTILERGDELFSSGYEPEVGPSLRTLLEAEGIHVLTRAAVTAVRTAGDSVIANVQLDGKLVELTAERLLVAIGRRPNTDQIGLEKAGVAIGEHEQIVVDKYLRTSMPNIFAAGDVIARQLGGQMVTPVGSQDGGIAANNALSPGPARAFDHRVVPRAVFIDPPLATVGLTEEQAVAAGHPCWCRTLPMSLVPRAGAIRDERGFIKMVAHRETHEVLGVTMLGHSATEVIHEAAMALRFRAKLSDFIELLHVYPTMSEALKLVAISRFKDPAKLSCCAE